jgi:DsbC/DsbD-like thiol-disulfide interchange protein
MALPGFHVNSDKPGGEYTVPLRLKWSGAPLEAENVKYPKPEEINVGTETLSVFTGSFTIETEFKAPADAPPGPATVDGKIHYQACNTQMCFRPATLDVRVPVLIE